MNLHPELQVLYDAMLPLAQRLHAAGALAPHAAALGHDGTLRGSALAAEDTQALSVEQALEHFESGFRREAAAGDIVACATFFHASVMDEAIAIARTEARANAIVANLEHTCGDAVLAVVPYRREAGMIRYDTATLISRPARVFAQNTETLT